MVAITSPPSTLRKALICVSQVNADAEWQPQGARLRVGLRHQALLHPAAHSAQRTAQGRRCAAKRQQHRIARHVDHAALLFGARIAEHGACGVQQLHRQPVVDGHQAGIAGGIGRQDGGQARGGERR